METKTETPRPKATNGSGQDTEFNLGDLGPLTKAITNGIVEMMKVDFAHRERMLEISTAHDQAMFKLKASLLTTLSEKDKLESVSLQIDL